MVAQLNLKRTDNQRCGQKYTQTTSIAIKIKADTRSAFDFTSASGQSIEVIVITSTNEIQ